MGYIENLLPSTLNSSVMELEFPTRQIDRYSTRFDGGTRFSHYRAWYADHEGNRFHCDGKTILQAVEELHKTLEQHGISIYSLPPFHTGATYIV